MTSRPKQPKYARNKNILVIGGSGSGKTRFFVKPSIMQMHSSYVITDPKGQLLTETGKMLLHGAPKLDENGKPVRDGRGKIIYEPYHIKVLNTINFSKSMKYNPLAYVRSEKDILKLVNVIIANTKGDGEKSSEDFWVKAERLLYCALIGYIWYEAEPEEPIQTGKRTRKPEPAIPAESSRARIDIPVDDPVDAPAPKPEKTGFTGFFRHRSEQQKTPAQIVAAQKAAAEESEPYEDGDPFAVKAPAAPVMPPKSIQAKEEPARRPAIPTMEPVVLSQLEEPAAAAQPMTASPAASASVSAPAAAVQEPLSKKAAAQAVAAETAAVTAEIAENMTGSETEYRYPPVSLLRENQGENHIAAGAELRNNSRRLAETLSSFGVDAKAGDVIHGPSVTRYEFTLDQGVKLSKITNLQDDIALALGASGVRIAAVPNKISVVGIEVPNRTVTPVLIRD